MDENNTGENIKQKAVNGAKKTAKEIMSVIWKVLKPILIIMGKVACILLAIALLVWAIDKELFDTGSSSTSMFNSGGTTYTDEETDEEVSLIGINEEGTMWVIPDETIDYIRKQLMESSDIIRLNLTDEIDSFTNMESEENREKLNRYIREFLKAELVIYYSNLEY